MSYEPDINHRIWQVVTAILKGKVVTYGGVAKKAELGRATRRIGLGLRGLRGLRGLPGGSLIPWHRVVNAQGRVSLPNGSASHKMQRDRLEAEGIIFRTNNTIDLKQYGWWAGNIDVNR